MEYGEIKAGLDRYMAEIDKKMKKENSVLIPRHFQKTYTLDSKTCYRKECLKRDGVKLSPVLCLFSACPFRITDKILIENNI